MFRVSKIYIHVYYLHYKCILSVKCLIFCLSQVWNPQKGAQLWKEWINNCGSSNLSLSRREMLIESTFLNIPSTTRHTDFSQGKESYSWCLWKDFELPSLRSLSKLPGMGHSLILSTMERASTSCQDLRLMD